VLASLKPLYCAYPWGQIWYVRVVYKATRGWLMGRVQWVRCFPSEEAASEVVEVECSEKLNSKVRFVVTFASI
jgi:hypothetical protein